MPRAPTYSIGSRVGPYEIGDLIGSGGMGEVYRARDTRLGRTVAIKILLREKTGDVESRRRFLQEARAVSALNHPNIVMLHDMSNYRGVDYLVMEYVQGTSLDKLITPKGLALAEALDYAQQIAHALSAAHAAGIVHRDVKPANVIVTAESQVKVLDFGLAKLSERAPVSAGETRTESAYTEAGAVMGTVAYMSPEQANGKALDHRTDIFSLGVILYEMLAGRHPFSGTSPIETMHAIIRDAMPPLPAHPPGLGEILEKALAKDPKDRYQHVGDLALDLRRFRQRPAAGRSNRRVGVVVAILLLVAAVAATALLMRTGRQWINPLENAQFTRLTDFDGSELDAALSPDGKFVAFLSDQEGLFDAFIGQVGAGDFVNVTRGRFPELFHEQLRSIGFSGDGNEIWLRVSATASTATNLNATGLGIWMIPTMGGAPRRFLEQANAVIWSPDGAQIAYFEPRPGDPIFVAGLQGINPHQIYVSKPGEHTHYESYSPDGRYIYFTRGFRSTEMDVWRVPAAGGQAERLTHHNSRVSYPVALDDRTLLYIGPAGNGAGSWLYAMDMKTRATHRANLGLEDFISIAASNGPNGPMTRLTASVANPRGTLWTLAISDHVVTDSEVKPLRLPTVDAVSPRYGPNYLLYRSSKGGGDGLWKFQDGVATELWKSTDEALAAPATISPDGLRICFTVRKGERQHLYLMSAEGTGIRPLAEMLDVRDAASWSRDGRYVVASVDEGSGGRIYRIPVDGGAPERLVDEVSYNPVCSPDGRLILYYLAPRGALFPLRAITPEKKPFKLPEVSSRGEGGRFRFLPDGRSFVVLQGRFRNQNFYLVDVYTCARRQLTDLKPGFLVRNFDISSDGKQIIFDRIQENADVVLIDLPGKK